MVSTSVWTNEQLLLIWNGGEWDRVESMELAPNSFGQPRYGAPRAIDGVRLLARQDGVISAAVSDTDDGDRFFDHAYVISTSEDTLDHYARFAEVYNVEVTEQGYAQPRRTVEMLERYGVTTDTKTLDVGCGTGLSGIFRIAPDKPVLCPRCIQFHTRVGPAL